MVQTATRLYGFPTGIDEGLMLVPERGPRDGRLEARSRRSTSTADGSARPTQAERSSGWLACGVGPDESLDAAQEGLAD
ncbi:hypothetical protein ABZS66_61145, partial [Dactylosporangium sp. NPDC005572]|uniref:hypothetical protein n=1 Tax=Dactylosporangium sp. NPDC005572 TaxID=3156889 RepID=UPI0033B20C1A